MLGCEHGALHPGRLRQELLPVGDEVGATGQPNRRPLGVRIEAHVAEEATR